MGEHLRQLSCAFLPRSYIMIKESERSQGNRSAGGYARAAAIDASMRNLKNKSQWPNSYITAAEGIKWALDSIYRHGGMYINYRKKFISVKLEDPIVDNNQRRAAAEFKQDLLDRGAEIVHTEQGLVVRILKTTQI